MRVTVRLRNIDGVVVRLPVFQPDRSSVDRPTQSANMPVIFSTLRTFHLDTSNRLSLRSLENIHVMPVTFDVSQADRSPTSVRLRQLSNIWFRWIVLEVSQEDKSNMARLVQ